LDRHDILNVMLLDPPKKPFYLDVVVRTLIKLTFMDYSNIVVVNYDKINKE